MATPALAAAAEMRARSSRRDAIIATLPEDTALSVRMIWAAMAEARRGRSAIRGLDRRRAYHKSAGQ
jgi:hypothetical protein